MNMCIDDALMMIINKVNKMVGKFDTIFENKIEMQAVNQIRLAKKNFIFRNVMLD